MYLYGGVAYALRTGQRRPADVKAGRLYAYRFDSSNWDQMDTPGGRDWRGCCSGGTLPGKKGSCSRRMCAPPAPTINSSDPYNLPPTCDPPQMRTAQGDYPTSTTLLALAFYGGALWAVPQLPSPRAGGRGSGSYRLHRFDPLTRRWSLVRARGAPPSARAEAAAVLLEGCGRVIVQGGVGLESPRRVLADAFSLDLAASPPAWERLEPSARGPGAADGGGCCAGGGMLAVAGHAGCVLGACAVFVGGARRLDLREPEPLVQVGVRAAGTGSRGLQDPPLRVCVFGVRSARAPGPNAPRHHVCPAAPQVLERTVAPPTPDAAAGGEASKARQHCRQQLARLLRSAAAPGRAGGGGAPLRGGGIVPGSVLLVPNDGGRPVRLPAALLALHSRLFLDMAQSGCLGGGDDDGDDAADSGRAPDMRVRGTLMKHVHVHMVHSARGGKSNRPPGMSPCEKAGWLGLRMPLLTLRACSAPLAPPAR